MDIRKRTDSGIMVKSSPSPTNSLDENKNENGISPYQEAFNYLKTKVPDFHPKIGVVCGSGLGGFVSGLDNVTSISYRDIPHFPVSTVAGHKGCLVFGHIDGKQIMCMQGRFHLYEGYRPDMCAFPIRIMKLFGVEKLALTNAAGGLNTEFKIGDFMILKDHIDLNALTGRNPLVGLNDPEWGPRFVPMHDAYDRSLQTLGLEVAKELNEKVQHGVYQCQNGPCYETIAEMRMAKSYGADALGMSTTYEVIAARHCGIRCFAVSLITNICSLDYNDEGANHEEVIEVGRVRSQAMTKFMAEVLKRW